VEPDSDDDIDESCLLPIKRPRPPSPSPEPAEPTGLAKLHVHPLSKRPLPLNQCDVCDDVWTTWRYARRDELRDERRDAICTFESIPLIAC
jgi:hypothetical protein